MSILKTGTTSSVLRAGAATALAIAAVGAAAAPSMAGTTATQTAMTLSTLYGKEAGGQSMTATTTVNKFYSGKVHVQFQTTTSLTGNCATTYKATAANSVIAAASTAIISSKKINIVVPNLTAASGSGTTQNWLVCAYNGTTADTSPLLARASFTSAGAPTVTTLTSHTNIPTYGGTTISVVGTNFTAGMTGTLGGAALTDINVVDSTLFTATTPPNAAGSVPLTVSAVGGSVTYTTAGTYDFVYVDALSVSPSTGVSAASTPVTVAIQGTGFNNIVWGDTTGAAVANTMADAVAQATGPDSANAHIYLLKVNSNLPVYAPTATFDILHATNITKGASAQAGECQNVAVISDTELICSLDLANGYVAPSATKTQAAQSTGDNVSTGVYALALVKNGAAVTANDNYGGSNNNVTTLASTNTFVVAPF